LRWVIDFENKTEKLEGKQERKRFLGRKKVVRKREKVCLSHAGRLNYIEDTGL
jgi:hypothetical protein